MVEQRELTGDRLATEILTLVAHEDERAPDGRDGRAQLARPDAAKVIAIA